MWVFPKIGIHFNRVFPYKPSIFGVPLFLETSIYSWKKKPVPYKCRKNPPKKHQALASGSSSLLAAMTEVGWGEPPFFNVEDPRGLQQTKKVPKGGKKGGFLA